MSPPRRASCARHNFWINCRQMRFPPPRSRPHGATEDRVFTKTTEDALLELDESSVIAAEDASTDEALLPLETWATAGNARKNESTAATQRTDGCFMGCMEEEKHDSTTVEEIFPGKRPFFPHRAFSCTLCP